MTDIDIVVLVGIGAFLLTGCIYLPIPEHKADNKPDFRDAVGSQQSDKLIRVGVTNRAGIISQLGKPQYMSIDRRAIGYEVATEAGALFAPLILYLQPTQRGIHLVKFVFDDGDLLQDWDSAHTVLSSAGMPLGYSDQLKKSSEQNAIKKLNEHPPELLYREEPDAKK